MVRWKKTVVGASAAALMLFGAGVGQAHAATTTLRVTESAIKDGGPQAADANWYREDTRPGGSVSLTRHLTSNSDGFTSAPGFGDGALALTTNNTDFAKAQLWNYSLAGTSLSTLSAADYWTYQSSTSGSVNDNASYQVRIDIDGNLNTTTDQANLVYETYWNDIEGNDPQGAIAPNTWQKWEAIDGDWWTSKQITCGDFSLAPGAGGPPFSRPGDIAAACPSAKIVAFGVNAGSYNRNHVVAVDGLHIVAGSTDVTYDFGPK